MIMHWPQITMLCLLVFSLARGALKNGESDGTVSFTTSLIGVVINAWLLYEGHFWTVTQ